MTGHRTNTGMKLNDVWKVGAKQARYHKDGHFFMPLTEFPGALFDPHGYLLFQTENEYSNCQYLSIGERVNVVRVDDISDIPGYIKIKRNS